LRYAATKAGYISFTFTAELLNLTRPVIEMVQTSIPIPVTNNR
jgi:hypothetical protein